MKNPARKLKQAIKALGPLQGLGFVARELAGPSELPVAVVEGGTRYRMWARPHSTDLAIYSQIFAQRDYDFAQWKPYWDYMRQQYRAIVSDNKVPVIIDGGANAGYSPIWFSLKFPQAKIIAVEPDPSNFALLQRNVSSFENIIPVEAALWDTKVAVAVKDPNDQAWGRRFDVAANDSGIPTVTVPELLEADPAYAPFIVKIDIEGAETQLFRSNTGWMDRFPLVVFEQHDSDFHWLGPWQGSAHSFFSTLSRRKREYLTRGENIFAFLHPTTENTAAADSGR